MLRATSFIAAALFATASLAQDSRTLVGDLTYLARIALPDNAAAIIEILDPMDALVGEARIATDGRQVPIPFEVDAPQGQVLRLQAGIAVGAEIRWISDRVRIEPDDPDGLGTLVLTQFTPLGFAASYRCGERLIRVGLADDRVIMDTGRTRVRLEPVPAASGARYEAQDEEDTFFWDRGGVALVSVAGDTLPECRLSVPIGSDRITARGNEPFWSVVIEGGRMVLDRLGMDVLVLPVTESRLSEAGEILVFAQDAQRALRAVLTRRDALCRDTMTGMPYPESVDLAMGDQVLFGCGGEPEDLLVGRNWVVEDVAGGGIVDSSRVEIAFDREGRVSGSGGCNRFFGRYTLTGEGLEIGLTGATRRACPEALMAQEQRFFDTLARVDRFDFDRTGALLLIGADQMLLRAR